MPNALTSGLPPLPFPQDRQKPQPEPLATPAQIPAPSHAQTVAALRHFSAIAEELETLLKDPDLGKADIKSKVIDGVANLVSQRLIPATRAVEQLSTFPDRPFDQKKWLIDHLQQTMKAEAAVLDHHRATNLGTGNPAAEQAMHPAANPDDHINSLAGMMQAHYA